MVRSILFLLACVVLATASWKFFNVFGQKAFLIMLAVTIAALLVKVGKPKENEFPE
ncbi:hypothetical protein [Hahella sp. CCB-MM4]|uniref:hypothetical protein n=1 Tax=Hahella sp. (strain CCB-MM4) TaxID=1926491 RepID=UPI00143DD7D3|nr:hypothetical protein [Hahella sp. CCB-MM4]